jgi:glutaredoxin 3
MTTVTVYTKDLCGYCDAAKDLLTRMRVPFNEAKIGTDVTRDELLEVAPGAKTVPQIVIQHKVIGGYDDLCAYIENTGWNGSGY